jgi:alkyl hydroperoxide reductase subunit AhpC
MAGQAPVKKLRIGSVAPNFEADSTQGRLNFYDYIGKGWAILCCFPDDFVPVATTELVILSFLQEQFAQRNVKLLALSTQNRPTEDGNRYVSHKEWVQDVNDISPKPMEFPIAKDKDGFLSRLYNVLDKSDVENLSGDVDIATGVAFKSRTFFVIGPLEQGNHFIKVILNYPAAVGFSAELLRVVDALQVADSARVCTPANWCGQDVIIPKSVSDGDARKKFPDYKPVKPYLRFVELPPKGEEARVESVYFLKGALASVNLTVEENGQTSLSVGDQQYEIQPSA